MKTLIKLFVILLLLLFGCKEKDTIEVIPNYNEIYLPLNKVDSTPKLLEGNENELSDKINEEIKNSQTENKVKLDYKLLIDENGNVKKVEVVQCPDNKFTNIAVKYFEDWKFKPGMKDGKNVKSQYRWYFNFDKTMTNLSKINPDDYFVAVEQMPELIGGLAAIQKNIRYPEIAKRAGIEGKVYVKAYIDENGDVVKTEVVKGIGAGIDEAAQDAILKTKFKPGMQRGKNVKTQVMIPIQFKLE